MIAKFFALICSGLMVTAAIESPSPGFDFIESCDDLKPTPEFLVDSDELFRLEERDERKLKKIKVPMEVQTYINILTSGDEEDRISKSLWESFHTMIGAKNLDSKKRPDRSDIDSVIDLLNKDFGPAGLKFVLGNFSIITNKEWANTTDTKAMYKQLRQGNYAALNLYILEGIHHISHDPRGIITGYCAFPKTAAQLGTPPVYTEDGCGILSSFLTKHVLSHEVGHWFGLMHTFEDGCKGDGDRVNDTMAHKQPQINRCRSTLLEEETCDGAEGQDPSKNIMNHLTKNCKYDNFTRGQNKRIRGVWKHYRNLELPKQNTS